MTKFTIVGVLVETLKNKDFKLPKDDCLNCGGTLRRFNLGYDAATELLQPLYTNKYQNINLMLKKTLKTINK